MPRLDVAVIHRDGSAELVNAARPATLVAFTDEHDGKMFPESPREIAWTVHRALGIDQELDEWLAGLEDISANPADVRLARRIIAGDAEAKAIALGEVEPDEQADELLDPMAIAQAIEDLRTRGESRSPA